MREDEASPEEGIGGAGRDWRVVVSGSLKREPGDNGGRAWRRWRGQCRVARLWGTVEHEGVTPVLALDGQEDDEKGGGMSLPCR